MKKSKILICLALLCLCAVLLSGCAATYSLVQYTPWGTKEGGGFFKGLLDGYVALFFLIGSAFTSKSVVYETKNIGFLYDFGFIFGFIMFLASLSTDGGDGGNDKRKDKTPPDPGKPENRPGPGKKLPKRIGIRGTTIGVPVNPFNWRN